MDPLNYGSPLFWKNFEGRLTNWHSLQYLKNLNYCRNVSHDRCFTSISVDQISSHPNGLTKNCASIYVNHAYPILWNNAYGKRAFGQLLWSTANSLNLDPTQFFKAKPAKCFFIMGHSRPLFLYFRLFNTVDSK